MPTKDVNKLLKGASDCILAAVDDAGSASPAQCGDTFPLLSLGYMDENSIQSESKKITQKAQGGEMLQLGEIASVNINSLSGAGLGVNAAKKFKNAQCNIYGFGSQQSHKLTRFMMNVETPNDLKKDGKSVIQFSTEKKVSPDENLGTLGSAPAAFAADAAYKFNEIIKNIRQENLVFSVYPYLGNFGQATKLYDASDMRLLGSLLNGPTWGTAPDAVNSKLTFDGVNDYADFGDILNDDGVSDLLIECWVKILASSGTQTNILGKSSTYNSISSAGYYLYRKLTTNTVRFEIRDGVAANALESSALSSSVWAHVALSLDRNGSMQLYINGAASGSPTTCTVGSGNVPSQSFKIAKDSTVYGNLEIGAVRVYNFGANALPSNIATIIANHYNAEKAIFGL